MSKSQIKTMLIITFLNIKGTLYIQFIPQGQKVNQANYVEVLKRLREAVGKKSLDFGPTIRFSTMIILQLTRCSLSSTLWPKSRLLKWNTHPIPLIWL
jgi:hypothetical protein